MILLGISSIYEGSQGPVSVFQFSTLRMSRPIGFTLALTVPLLILLALLFEGVLRMNLVHERLATSRMGSRHSQLGEKLRLMEAVIATEGELDCVVLGSSVIDNGFDPLAFSRAYERVTGQKMTCFNFGIDAIPGVTAGVLADILVQDYQPEILIYGFDVREMVVARDDRDTTVVLDSPWIRYRAGHFNFEGWLYEYSYIKRFAPALKHLVVLDYENAFWKPQIELTALGYNPLHEVATDVQFPPQPDDDSFMVTYLSALLANHEMSVENLQGLKKLQQLNQNKAYVFLVMTPVANGYYSFYNNGRAEYEVSVHQLETLAAEDNVPFLRPDTESLIPADGWFDYMHVNVTGAEVFSDWVGVEVGIALENRD